MSTDESQNAVSVHPRCYRLWLFETTDGFIACNYDTSSYRKAKRTCELEYGARVTRGELVRLPWPEYRALLSVNRGDEWSEAYESLIGVFLDAYEKRNGSAR